MDEGKVSWQLCQQGRTQSDIMGVVLWKSIYRHGRPEVVHVLHPVRSAMEWTFVDQVGALGGSVAWSRTFWPPGCCDRTSMTALPPAISAPRRRLADFGNRRLGTASRDPERS